MSDTATRLGFDRQAKVAIYVVCTLIGLGLGFAVPYLAQWASELSWAPFQNVLQLVGSPDPGWLTWGRPLIGALVGVAFAVYIIFQSPVLYISEEQIEVHERGNTRRIPRSDIAGVYRDGGKVVVENHHGRRLFRGEVEGGKDTVRDTFVTHGHPWEAE